METLGQKIKRLRESQRLSQGDIEHKVGVSKEYLSRLEHDKASPTIGMLEKIAKALNCHVGDFLTDEEYVEQVSEKFLVKEGEQEYPVTIIPGVQRINVYSEDEADSVHKLLLILRGPDESAKISIKGFLDTIIGLIEKKAGKKESKRKAV